MKMQDLLKIAELIDTARGNLDTHRQISSNQLTELLQFAKDIDQTLLYVEKDLDDLQIEIDNRKDEIIETKRKIKATQKMNTALEKEQNRIQLKIDKLREQIRITEKELTLIFKQQEKAESKLSARRMDLQEIMNEVQSLETKIGGTKSVNEKTIGAKRHEREEVERSLKELREENVIADYLLHEGIRDSPEVGFLALLIQKTEVPLTKLRRESKLSVKAANELVETLQSKGIIAVQDAGTIRFLKPL
jgi:chromosome segregation ATPase